MPENVDVLCDGCGQTDTDPLIHVWGEWAKDDRTTITDPSLHFDCLPEQYRALLGDAPEHGNTRAAIAAADRGVRGSKLRTLIGKQQPDPEPEPADVEETV